MPPSRRKRSIRLCRHAGASRCHESTSSLVLTSDPPNCSPNGDNDVVAPNDERYAAEQKGARKE